MDRLFVNQDREDSYFQINYELIGLINNQIKNDNHLGVEFEPNLLEQEVHNENILQNLILIDKLSNNNKHNNNKINDLSQLFISVDPFASNDNINEFTSDMRIDSLGGLRLWQLTAILIIVLTLIGNFISKLVFYI
jgi:hypothetical protein